MISGTAAVLFFSFFAVSYSTVTLISCPEEYAQLDDVVLHQHDGDCSKFYVCEHGEPREFSCPDGLEFNSELRVCDYPENANCVLPEKDEETNKPEDETESPDNEPENQEIEPEKPDADTENPDDDTGKPEDETEKPEDETENPDDGTEKPEDDTENPDDDTEKPEDDTENPDDDTEKPEDDTENPDDDTEKPEYETPKPEDETEKTEDETGEPEYEPENPEFETENPVSSVNNCPSGQLLGYLRHETSCRQYYRCVLGLRFLQSCSLGLHFSLSRKTCTLPVLAGCDL